MTTTTQIAYFIVDAPGHYGDRSRVYSSHRSLAAAIKARGTDSTVVVRKGALRKGSTWLRASEAIYPIAHP